MVLDLRRALTAALGAPPLEMTKIADGHTGPVVAATTAAGVDVVVKLNAGDGDALLVEARMLVALAKHTRAPAVLSASERALVLERIDGTPLEGLSEESSDLATVLSALHDVTADRFGYHEETVIGGLPQPNPWTSTWVSFFGEQRLLAFAPADARARFEHLVRRLPDMLDEPDAPRLAHGDIWQGNVLTREGRVVGLIDPALAYVDAELDLALIGDVPGYFDLRPPRPGRAERKALYRLWPLLVHARLFGGTYRRQLDESLRALGF